MRLLFGRQWWWTTLLVIVAVAVMARLGTWQLDRLAQRRAFNARVSAQLNQPPLMLTAGTLGVDLTEMEYRSVVVAGRYDRSQEVALRNQVWGNQLGVHLLTPLVIEGSDRAVLVDRGWIPFEDWPPKQADQFAEPGTVEVHGVIRRSRSRSDFGGLFDPAPPPGERRLTWTQPNVALIDAQVSYPLLPVYIQQAPDPAWTSLPYRSQPELDLSEGPHLGYAIQWFLFAAILGIGYPIYVRQQSQQRAARPVAERQPGEAIEFGRRNHNGDRN
ncbi:MAG: SURF1 family protein [Ardenticatenaceae bacterium]|nr:SURF1 family protein [Ardenticatenaceae bacterium]HBY92393.1 SURF1 family protein [Chloroflexota bacterium]